MALISGILDSLEPDNQRLLLDESSISALDGGPLRHWLICVESIRLNSCHHQLSKSISILDEVTKVLYLVKDRNTIVYQDPYCTNQKWTIGDTQESIGLLNGSKLLLNWSNEHAAGNNKSPASTGAYNVLLIPIS